MENKFNRSNTHFIVGHHGAGKTYLVNQLIQTSKGILHLDTGPIIRLLHQRSKTELSFKEWIQKGELEYGSDFDNLIIAKEIKKQIATDASSNTLLITGNRSLRGIRHLSNQLEIVKPSIILIESIYPLIKQNYESREHKNLTDKEFMTKLDEEKRMGLSELIKYIKRNPDHCSTLYNLDNSDLIDQFNEIMQKFKKITKEI